MTQRFRGVYTIPVTPFDAAGEVDGDGLQRVVDWCVRAGGHGIVAPVNASEGPALTDEERELVTRLVVEATAGRVPVVIGVSGVSQQASVTYTRWAREARPTGGSVAKTRKPRLTSSRRRTCLPATVINEGRSGHVAWPSTWSWRRRRRSAGRSGSRSTPAGTSGSQTPTTTAFASCTSRTDRLLFLADKKAVRIHIMTR